MSETSKKQLQLYIGSQIVAARERSQPKVSQEALAEMTGTSRQNLGLIERGESWPSNDLMLSLSRALNLPPAYFFPNYILGGETNEQSRIIDQIANDALQLGPRKLKAAALVMRTLREDPGDLDA